MPFFRSSFYKGRAAKYSDGEQCCDGIEPKQVWEDTGNPHWNPSIMVKEEVVWKGFQDKDRLSLRRLDSSQPGEEVSNALEILGSTSSSCKGTETCKCAALQGTTRPVLWGAECDEAREAVVQIWIISVQTFEIIGLHLGEEIFRYVVMSLWSFSVNCGSRAWQKCN